MVSLTPPFMPTLTDIRPAVYDHCVEDGGSDVAIIRTYLNALPNPPYYPDAESFARLIEDPCASVFVSREYGLVARVVVLERRQEVMLPWFGPFTHSPDITLRTHVRRLRAVSLAAEQDALAKFPEAADWRYWTAPQVKNNVGGIAVVDGGRKLARYLQHPSLYPTGRILTNTDLGVSRVIFSSTLADVVAAAAREKKKALRG